MTGRSVTAITLVALLAVFSVTALMHFKHRGAGQSPDEQRVHDVLKLSWHVALHRQIKGKLPDDLSALRQVGLEQVPVDPVTSRPYPYEVLGPDSFRLCATFSSQAAGSRYPVGTVHYGDPVVHGYGTWTHGKGRQCIDRKVKVLPID